jgi:hypothetical protein
VWFLFPRREAEQALLASYQAADSAGPPEPQPEASAGALAPN